MLNCTKQWCVQVDVTNRCNRSCANCTRMLAHARTRFVMDVDFFARAIAASVSFLTESEADRHGRQKVLGIIGGEPLSHPRFETLCDIMREQIPNPKQRGLWTGIDWRSTHHRATIERTFGYINENRHTTVCRHQPVLAAVQELEPGRMWDLIRACPLQEEWSSSITPKGDFFCEVAAGLDMVFDGPGGLPVTKDWWKQDLSAFQDQIDRWCPRCGVCIPWPEGRLDSEEIDDMTPGNVEELRRLGSPRVLAGKYHLHTPANYRPVERDGWAPLKYLKKE